MSAQEKDVNGYVTIEKNPISRVGVFPYLGKNISSECEPDKIYNVYRPADELSDPDAMASFALVPLVDDHTMLGEGFTPVEEKGAHGVLGENLQFEDGVLYAPLKIFSETLKKLIASGKKALSLGYRVREWQREDGTFEGKDYQFVQRGLRGNHIALVDAARCDVAVLDHHFACDSFDIAIDTEIEAKKSNDETTVSEKQAAPTGETIIGAADQPKGDDAMTDEEKKKKEAMDRAAKDESEKKEAEEKAAKDEAEEKEKAEKKAADESEEEKKKKEAMDKAAKDADTKEKEGDQKAEDKAAMDSAIKVAMDSDVFKAAVDASVAKTLSTMQPKLMKQMAMDAAERDTVIREVSSVIGTFDAAEKTTGEVLSYGLEKVGIKAPKGQEQGAWAGYMAGRSAKSGVVLAFDSKSTTAGLLDKTLANSK